MKTTLAVYLISYKLKFFERLIIFLEPTIKLITGIFDLRNNNSDHHGTNAFIVCSNCQATKSFYLCLKVYFGITHLVRLTGP